MSIDHPKHSHHFRTMRVGHVVHRIGKSLAVGILLATGIVLTTSSPAAAACTKGTYRAGDFGGPGSAINVKGTLQTPFSGEVTGFSTSLPSSADVYITMSSTDFVQVGWYLGKASELPYTTVPRMFVGEYYAGDQNNELLQPGPTLSWGTMYSFQILRGGTAATGGHYYKFYLQGVQKYQSTRGHAASGTPAFNGETDSTCTVMEGRAYHSGSPGSTLEYQISSGPWTYFDDDYVASTNYYSYAASGPATDFAYGG